MYDAKLKTKVVIEALTENVGLDNLSIKYGIPSAIVEEWKREIIQKSFGAQEDSGVLLFEFMNSVILKLKDAGKIGTANTYQTTLNSFKRFKNSIDISLDDLTSEEIKSYESYLVLQGLSPNSTSFYMRILRAVYNRAVDQGLTIQKTPFKNVYTGVEKTQKRALPLKKIRMIKELDLSKRPRLEYARDMFLFSFYTRGMSFVDMAYLKKNDLKGGFLTYRRRKTGQLLTIKWEKNMQKIVDKYKNDSEYLLPILNTGGRDIRKQYIYAGHNINRSLKKIGEMVELAIPLTMYVSRHSWASIAKSKNIPLSVISQGMGHDSERTTLIYLTSLDTVAVDKANSLIINSLK